MYLYEANYISVFPTAHKVRGKTERKRFLIKLIICNGRIFEKVQSMHQTESPPTKIYEQDKANDWSESMTRDNYFKLAPKLKLGFAHCGGMLVIGILKKGNSWLFNTNCAQNRLAVNHPTVFYHIGEGSLSHVFVFYTRWQTNTIPFF